MGLGDILKEGNLNLEVYPVKADTDITKGYLYCDDGAGLVLATQALRAAGKKVVMPIEDHDYSEESTHNVTCVEVGLVECAKLAGSGATRKGDKIGVSTTPGSCGKSTKGDAPTGGVSTYYTATIEAGVQTALDANLLSIGTSHEAAADADTTQKLWLGVY